MKNGVLSQLSFRQLREYPILCQMCCYHFIHQSLHNVHLLCLFSMIFLIYFILWWTHLICSYTCFNCIFLLHVLVDPPHFLKIDFTIILILHILVDSPLSWFLVTIIGLVYRLDLLVLVVRRQGHLVQVLHQH